MTPHACRRAEREPIDRVARTRAAPGHVRQTGTGAALSAAERPPASGTRDLLVCEHLALHGQENNWRMEARSLLRSQDAAHLRLLEA